MRSLYLQVNECNDFKQMCVLVVCVQCGTIWDFCVVVFVLNSVSSYMSLI